MLAKSRNYWLDPKYIFEQAFYRLILLIQKNKKINILSVPLSFWISRLLQEQKKGSDEWHFDHCTIIFWVKRTFKSDKLFQEKKSLQKLVAGIKNHKRSYFVVSKGPKRKINLRIKNLGMFWLELGASWKVQTTRKIPQFLWPS